MQSFSPGLRELCSSFSVPPVPIAAVVVFLMRQERSDVDMPWCLSFLGRLSIVDDSNKPVPVVPDVKNHIAIHRISVFEHAANIIKFVPAN